MPTVVDKFAASKNKVVVFVVSVMVSVGFVLSLINKLELKVASPATVKVVAMSTAPSISTTSRLVVPSISASPEMSSVAASNSPVIVKLRIPV